MEWNAYNDKKPADKKARYLIEFGWAPDVSVIGIAHWNGKTFYNEDWETCLTYKYGNQVRNWVKIIPPKKKE